MIKELATALTPASATGACSARLTSHFRNVSASGFHIRERYLSHDPTGYLGATGGRLT